MLTPLLLISLIALIIGSYTDIKTREIPDWINYGLIFIGVFAHLIYSLVTNNWIYLLNSLAGLGLCLLIALGMFYSGQWGGGDSKMLMALGALIGLDFSLSSFLVSLLVNIFLIGAVYGVLYGIYLAVRSGKKFTETFKGFNRNKRYSTAKKAILLLSVVLVVLSFFFGSVVQLALLFFVIVVLASFYLLLFAKSVEKCCMFRLVEPKQLTEGDWIAKNVFVGGKYVCGPKDLGVSKEQIGKLIQLRKQNKIEKILIKEGIPFVPSFLLSLIFTYLYGNIILFFI